MMIMMMMMEGEQEDGLCSSSEGINDGNLVIEPTAVYSSAFVVKPRHAACMLRACVVEGQGRGILRNLSESRVSHSESLAGEVRD